jgi:hypothetical protein
MKEFILGTAKTSAESGVHYFLMQYNDLERLLIKLKVSR